MDNVVTYFANLAKQATGQLERDHPTMTAAARVVEDTGQNIQTTAWQAVAVHPLQVLETEYQAVVRELTAGADGDEQRRDREKEAMSRFFGISGTEPQLLDIDVSSIAQDLQRTPLLDSELTAIRAQLFLAKSLIDKPSDGLTAYGEMSKLVERAVAVMVLMAPAKDPKAVAPKLRVAFEYLGLFAPHTPTETVQAWVRTYQNHTQPNDLKALAAELAEKLVEPLANPANAVASARCLYNIRKFYLLRLMHRFHGGSSIADMSPPIKQEASGLVTKGMHPAAFGWLAAWHEGQIADLARQMLALEAKLQAAFNRSEPVLRFFLKGGRALFTALGTPLEGANDWDTGVLINPSLAPKQWYTAFAAVNDVLTVALDRLRFGYTQLMYQHSADLAPHLAANFALGLAGTAGLTAADDEEVPEFTTMGAAADEMLRRTVAGRSPSVAALGLMSPAALQAVVNNAPRPAGVNGELIDIGIATRSSVELREHWTYLQVMNRPGISGTAIPVPDLGFFIDDFSTILRDEIAAGGEADRKLAKRLQRLGRVLGSTDQSLRQAVASRWASVQQVLPKTAHALTPSPDAAAGRLQIWTLGALVDGLDPQTAGRAGYVASLDAYVADAAQQGRLYDENSQTVRGLWAQIEDACANEPDKGASARTLLAIQTGTHALATVVINGFGLREKYFGVADLQNPLPGEPWKTIADLLTQWTKTTAGSRSQGVGPLIVTGTLATRLQLMHAGLDAKLAAGAWPVELIELELCMDARDLGRAEQFLQMLSNFVGSAASRVNIAIVGSGAAATLSVSGKPGFIEIPSVIPDRQPVILTIRPVDAATRSLAVCDSINGWLVLPARSLALQALDWAAEFMDYDLRELARGSVRLLTEEILGRQL